MKMTFRLLLVFVALVMAGCADKKPHTAPTPMPEPTQQTDRPADDNAKPASAFDGPGHNLANAIEFRGISNPLAFSQKQQEWLWLNYRDWKKQGQSLREKNGVQYDEVTLVNQHGETRVLYFRMPVKAKP